MLPGVTVGDYSIVGAGSVVTKDIPTNSIVVGNPARVLRKIKKSEKNNLIETMKNYQLFGWDSTKSIEK